MYTSDQCQFTETSAFFSNKAFGWNIGYFITTTIQQYTAHSFKATATLPMQNMMNKASLTPIVIS